MRHRPPSGLLSRQDRPFSLQQFWPEGRLADFVDYFWVVQWHFAAGESFVSENLPHPCVHLVYETHNTALYGPIKGHFKKTLTGHKRAIGCRFRAGLFYPWLQRPVADIAGQQLDAGTVLSVSSRELETRLDQQPDIDRAISLFTDMLNQQLTTISDNHDQACLANRIVITIENDPELLKVEQVCARFQLSLRQLERLFHKYVGLTPKWVLRIYRLQQLANEIVNGQVTDWTELAHRLGYFDQAHCIRDFKQITGKTPSWYG